MKKSLMLILMFVTLAVMAFASLNNSKKKRAAENKAEKKAEMKKTNCMKSCVWPLN